MTAGTAICTVSDRVLLLQEERVVVTDYNFRVLGLSLVLHLLSCVALLPLLELFEDLNAGLLDLHGRLLLFVVRLLIAESTDHHVAFGGIRDEGWILCLRHGEELLAS